MLAPTQREPADGERCASCAAWLTARVPPHVGNSAFCDVWRELTDSDWWCLAWSRRNDDDRGMDGSRKRDR